MAAARSLLCEYCSQIDFGPLECPTISDLPVWEKEGCAPPDEYSALRLVSPEYQPPQRLGTLARIKASATSCQICDLIWSIIIREHFDEEPELRSVASGGREIECFLYLTPYGNFLPFGQPATSPSYLRSQNIIRRVSLRMGVPPNANEDDSECYWWHIRFCMQACANDGSSMSPLEAWYGDADSEALAYGGRRRPLTIDLDWIRQWMRICQTEHDGLCSDESSDLGDARPLTTAAIGVTDGPEPGSILRLINVELACVETFRFDHADLRSAVPSYAALSYLWGRDQPVKLLKSNEQDFRRPGILKQTPPCRTVADAMALLSRLAFPGLQYLWVDALCILQDSDDDKGEQIANMGQIYTNAVLTIVAGAGEDCEAGLPGLYAGTRSVKQRVVSGIRRLRNRNGQRFGEAGFSIMETLNPLADLNDDFWNIDYWCASTYSTRGWTLQENFLSKRCLLFTPEQVYFECPRSRYCEESHFESRRAEIPYHYGKGARCESINDIRRALQGSKTMTRQQLNVVHAATSLDFGRRTFTNAGDALHGMAGITQAISALTGETFLWGMPTYRLDLALLFHHKESPGAETVCRRRAEITTLPVSNLKERIRLPSWSILGWSGDLEYLSPIHQSAMYPEIICFIHSDGGKMLINVGESSSATILSEEPLQPPVTPLRSRWHPADNTAVTSADVQRELPGLYAMLPSVPEGIVLFFWTSISSFRIYDENERHKIVAPAASIIDTDHHWGDKSGPLFNGVQQYWVGTLYGAGDRDWTKSLECAHAEEERLADFIVVGRIITSAGDHLIVMLVAWRGHVAMRCGLGYIKESAWIASRPRWRLIALG